MRRDVSETLCEVSSDEMTDTYGVTHTHTQVWIYSCPSELQHFTCFFLLTMKRLTGEKGPAVPQPHRAACRDTFTHREHAAKPDSNDYAGLCRIQRERAPPSGRLGCSVSTLCLLRPQFGCSREFWVNPNSI